MLNHITEFIESLKEGEIELYNEAGLQHELGYFLRQKNIKLKFEYNINLLNIDVPTPLKKEIDLFIEDKNKKILIELKFPNRGAFPRRMTQSIIDIFFIQQLIDSGFEKGYFIFFTGLNNFSKGKSEENIYSYFRKAKLINEFSSLDIPNFMLKKPDGKNFFSHLEKKERKFKKDLKISFLELKNNGKEYLYFILEI